MCIRLVLVSKMKILRNTQFSSNSTCLMEGRRRTIAMVMGSSQTSGLNRSRCGRLKLPTSLSHPSTQQPLAKYVHIHMFVRMQVTVPSVAFTRVHVAQSHSQSASIIGTLYMVHICNSFAL